MLNGVSEEHRGWIEAVQPYNCVAWTGWLQALSNDDKHNFLHQVVPTVRFNIDLHGGIVDTDDPATLRYRPSRP